MGRAFEPTDKTPYAKDLKTQRLGKDVARLCNAPELLRSGMQGNR
jgi:hypothetical protein